MPRARRTACLTAPALVAVLIALAGGAAPAMADSRQALEARAQRGDAASQYTLAMMSRKAGASGMDRSVALLCRAAGQGHVDAAYQLGRVYLTGIGAPLDPDMGAAWLRRASARGHSGATAMLRTIGPTMPVMSPTCGGRAVPAMPAPVPAGSGVGRTGPDGAGGYSNAAFTPPPSGHSLFASPLFRDTRPLRSAAPPADAPADVVAIVNRHAATMGLDPALVLAVMRAESRYRPDAVSPKKAAGLMQLMPATARRFGVADVFDPEDNIVGGMRYLRWLLNNFQGDVTKTVAAYNAGEGAVEQHDGVPPYAETQEYVQRVRAVYDRDWHPYAPPAP